MIQYEMGCDEGRDPGLTLPPGKPVSFEALLPRALACLPSTSRTTLGGVDITFRSWRKSGCLNELTGSPGLCQHCQLNELPTARLVYSTDFGLTRRQTKPGLQIFYISQASCRPIMSCTRR